MYPRKPKKIHSPAYYQGHTAREAGRCRMAQPYQEMIANSARWLAGW